VVPLDLRSIVTQIACADEEIRSTPLTLAGRDDGADSVMVVWALAHDVGQLLIFLMQQNRTGSDLPLLHGIWLDQRALRLLNQRLITPDSGPIPSHKQTSRLRWIMFLTAAAGLQKDGLVTVAGRAWIQANPPKQISWLWQGWRDADGQLRSRYGLADSLLPSPWPEPLLLALANTIHQRKAITSTIDLMNGLLDARTESSPTHQNNCHKYP